MAITPSLKAFMRSGFIGRVCRRRGRLAAPARRRAGSARPAPACAARSTGLKSRHERSERQPQPMQEARSSRTRSSSAMRSSTSRRQARESLRPVALGGRAVGGQQRERVADRRQRDARRAPGLDHRHAAQHGALVAPLVALAALGGDQALGLVEAQRRRARRRCAARPVRSSASPRARASSLLHTSSALQLCCLTSSALEIVASRHDLDHRLRRPQARLRRSARSARRCCGATPSTIRAPPRRSTSTGCSTTACST